MASNPPPNDLTYQCERSEGHEGEHRGGCLGMAEIDRLREVIKAAAQVCRSADKMNSLGPIQALAIALDREVPNG